MDRPSSVRAVELEDRISLPSAEGIDLDLVLAGIGSRSLALLVDLTLQMLALFLLALVADALGDGGAAFASVGAFLVLLGYPILFEAFNGGRTLGKAWLGIAAVADDGTPLRFLPAVIRNVVRVVDSLPGTYTVGLIAVLATERNQRVGDLAAGSLVIRRPRVHSTVPMGAIATPPAAVPGPPPEMATWDVTAVTADEVAAIRSFLGRRHDLAAAPRFQIADALARQILPKVAGVPAADGPEAFLERVAAAKVSR